MTKIIGHRGGRNLWPENSLEGFQKLADTAADGVEFDVHLTDEGELLVIHDPTLERTTDHSGPVARLPKGAHRTVKLKDSNDQVIPTLREVLELLQPTELELHIELKLDAAGVPYAGLEALVAEMVDGMGLSSRSILTSFTPSVLAKVRSIAPQFRTLCSFDTKSAQRLGLVDGLNAALNVSDIIAVEKALLETHWDEILALVPRDRLGVWVPNEEDNLAFWLARPMRQLTTDRPDRALRLRGN